MPERFQLDSGRSVILRQFFVRGTDEGFLEGSPKAVALHVLKHLPDTIAQVFWDGAATLILKPDDEQSLPAYTLIAHLQSLDGTPGAEPGEYSRLLVAWFDDDIDASPLQLAERALRGIDWDGQAENWVE